jgi:ketosteroid isomerase-like protein
MRYLAVGGLFVAAALFMAGKEKFSAEKYQNLMVQQTLINTEKAWNEALISKDVGAADRIMAEEFTGIDFLGQTISKNETLAELEAGQSRNEFVELGDMDVRVYGDTAVVIGTDTEKSVYQGKNSNGSYAFTDVFVKRDGRWQAVASQSTKMVFAPELPIPTN